MTIAVFPSGMRLLILPDRTSRVVAARALWLGGQRLEDERTTGLHHLLAQTITRGTRTRTAEQIAVELDAMAASLSGVAGQNSFSVELEVLGRHFDRAFDLFADCILHPRFAEGEVEREKRLLLGTLGPQHDSPRKRGERALREMLHGKHPMRFDLEGTAESVAAIGRRQLVDAHRTRLGPGQMVLAVVGDVDPDAVLRRVRARFEEEPPPQKRLRNAAKLPPAATTPITNGPQHRVVDVDRNVAWVGVGFVAVPLQDPDRAALELLVAMLGGQGGRLFVELRDRAALGYDVQATSSEGIDRGQMIVSVATSVDRAAEAEQRLLAELARLTQTPPTVEELARARRWLLGDMAARLERRSALSASLAFYEAAGLGWDAHVRFREQLGQVTPEQVKRVAEQLLSSKQAAVVVGRPPDEKQIAAPPGPRTSKNLRGGGRAKAAKGSNRKSR